MRYSISAVSFIRGTNLPTVGPGISALRMCMGRSETLGSIAITKTIIPIPPTQWVKLRQKSTPWVNTSTLGIMEAPVVVKPLTISKNASA